MKPAAFEYHRPETMDDALGLLATHGEDAAVLAGGQSLVPMMNLRMARPLHLIDVNRLTGLDRVRLDGEFLEIGALIRHHDLAGDAVVRRHCPVLARAAGTIGHYAIRQRGTLGGSLAMADPSAQLPVVAVLLDARITLRSGRGERVVEAGDFFIGAMTTEKEEDEIITSVRFPVLGDDEGFGFELFAPRAGDYAVVLVAATLRRDTDGAVVSGRLALGGVEGASVVVSEALAAHVGRLPDADWPAAVAEDIAGRIEPEASGPYDEDYKRDLVRALVERALGAAVKGGEGAAA